jgi:hypothetical protein
MIENDVRELGERLEAGCNGDHETILLCGTDGHDQHDPRDRK